MPVEEQCGCGGVSTSTFVFRLG